MATKAELALGTDYVRERFEYRDGVLYRAWVGTRAGTIKKGYVVVSVSKGGQEYHILGHRVIWMLHHGDWPSLVIDHINRDKTDNRIENLRDVPPDANLRNNGNARGTGLLGAYRHPRAKTFYSQISRAGWRERLGTFKTAEEAHAAFIAATAEKESI